MLSAMRKVPSLNSSAKALERDARTLAGDPDLSLVEYCLSLTPAERLQQVEEFAEFVLTARAKNGVRWSDSRNCSGS